MTYRVADPDPILAMPSVMTTERRTLPMDLRDGFMERHAAFYAAIESTKPGILLGNVPNPYRRGEMITMADRTDRFGINFAPTRSGKGVSFAFPNTLSWTQSLFVNDPKKELCAGTAWFRKYRLGQRILIVEPFANDGRNARFNPLEEIRLGTKYEVTDATNIATAIVDPDGAGFEGDSGVWRKRARELMTGLILHVLYCDDIREKSLRMVDAILTEAGVDLQTKYRKIQSTIHDPERKMFWRSPLTGEPTQTHPIVIAAMQDQIDRPEGEGGSVKSEQQSFTAPYRNPTLGDNTAVSDFSIADIMDGPVPTTVYFVISPDTLEQTKGYARLFLNLLINRNVGPIAFSVAARPIDPHRFTLALLIDEFPMLGKLDIFASQLAYIATYKLKPFLIAQDSQQIVEVYGRDNNIISNMHTQIYSATNNATSAEALSQMLGKGTHYSYEGSGRERRLSVDGVPLLDTNQAMLIDNDEQIIKIGGVNPIPSKKLKYYADDSEFAARVRRTDFASDVIPRELRANYARLERERRENYEARKIAFERGNAPIEAPDGLFELVGRVSERTPMRSGDRGTLGAKPQAPAYAAPPPHVLTPQELASIESSHRSGSFAMDDVA
jgi:type IV secretion system protein VirD4